MWIHRKPFGCCKSFYKIGWTESKLNIIIFRHAGKQPNTWALYSQQLDLIGACITRSWHISVLLWQWFGGWLDAHSTLTLLSHIASQHCDHWWFILPWVCGGLGYWAVWTKWRNNLPLYMFLLGKSKTWTITFLAFLAPPI